MAQISFNRCLNKQAMAHPYNAAAAAAAKSLQSCPNLCDPIDGTPAEARKKATLLRLAQIVNPQSCELIKQFLLETTKLWDGFSLKV